MSAKKVPTHVTVAVPHSIRAIAGIHSSYEDAIWLNMRASELDRELIEKAAAICDVTRSMFVRWVALSAAKQVIQAMEDKDGRRDVAS